MPCLFQKHPLKQAQFLRNSNYQMPPNMRMPGPGMTPNGPQGPHGPHGPPGMKPGPDNSMNTVAQWVQQQNDNLQQQGVNFSPTSGNPPFSPTGQNFGPGGPSPSGPWPAGQGPPPQGMQSPEFMMEGGPGFPGGQQGFNMMNAGGPSNNLLQNKVPNENLTQEQLHKREESLANLRKIQQMLFPDQQRGDGMMPNGPGRPMGPPGMIGPDKGPMGPGMMPGGPMMSPNQQMMGGPDMPPMGPMGPMGPGPDGQMGPQLPPNWETMTPAQREWFKLQHDFYITKRRKAQIDQMKRMEDMQRMQMGMRGGAPPGGPGPPPPYGMGGMRRQGMPMGASSPTSPNGPHMGSSGHPSPAPSEPFMFPGGPRHPMMGPGPRMPGGFDPSMDPNMSGGMFMRDDPRAQHPGGKMPMIHMAGNPEQFTPEVTGPGTPQSNASGATKPPPSYAQAQKRKRSSGDDMDDPYKKLQPAPSPQQFSYLHQFDGQELTITKQLNVAYKEGSDEASPAAPLSQSNPTDNVSKSVQSPKPSVTPTLGDRNTPATTVSSTASPHPVSSVPTPSTPTSTSLNNPNPTPAQQSAPQQNPPQNAAQNSQPPPNTQHPPNTQQPPNNPQQPPNTQRLTHYDNNAAVSAANNKASLNNITSASLANLAKGVEHLSHQMQQDMMQGGPFHNIQIQGQMSEIENGPGPSPGGPGSQQPATPGQQQMPPDPSSGGQGQSQGQPPSVNNTYVNANLSIQQLNIQSINQSGNGPNVANPAMQTQQMNNENMTGMPPQQGPGPVPTSGPMTPQSPYSSVDPMAQKMGPSLGQPQRPMNSNMQPQGPMSAGHMNGPPQSQSPNAASIGSPGYRPSSTPVCNANVQIQAKAPNTIQYLPANPPSSVPGPMGPQRPEMPPEMMMARFPSPHMDPKMGGKMPFSPQGDPMMERMSMPPHGPGSVPMQHMSRPGMPPVGPGGMPGGPGGMPGGPGGMPGGPGGMPGGPGGMSMQQQQFMMQSNGPGPRMQGQMSSMQFGRPSPGPMPGGMMSGPGGMGGPPSGPNSMGMMASDAMMQGQQMQGQSMMQMQGMGGPGPQGGPPSMRGDPNGMMGGPPGFNPQYQQQFQQGMFPQGGPGGGMHPGMPRPMSPGMHAMMQQGGPMPSGPMGPGGAPMGPSSGGPPGGMMGMPPGAMNQYGMMP